MKKLITVGLAIILTSCSPEFQYMDCECDVITSITYDEVFYNYVVTTKNYCTNIEKTHVENIISSGIGQCK